MIFLHHIDGISPSIKFTGKIEENRSLTFLDVRVSRSPDNTLWTNVYENLPTQIGIYNLIFTIPFTIHQKLAVTTYR